MADDAKAFQLQISQEWLATQEKIADAVAEVGLDALTRIVLKSPVDTGRFRGNWQTTTGAAATDDLETVDKTGAATINAGAAVLEGYDDLVPIFLTNNLPYAIRLEEGHSATQAPLGVVAVTLVELETKYSAVNVQ